MQNALDLETESLFSYTRDHEPRSHSSSLILPAISLPRAVSRCVPDISVSDRGFFIPAGDEA